MKQIRIMAWRRYLIHLRTEKGAAKLFGPFFCFILAAFLLETWINIKDNLSPPLSSFKDYKQVNPSVVFVHSDNVSEINTVKRIKNETIKMIQEDIGLIPNILTFHDVESMNYYLYNLMNDKNNSVNYMFGIAFDNSTTDDFLPIIYLYNDTEFAGNPGQVTTLQQLHKIIWRSFNLGFMETRGIRMYARHMAGVVTRNTAMFIILAVLTVCSFVSYYTIVDYAREKKQYMEMFGLKSLGYYIGIFLVDYSIWIFMSIIGWIILRLIKSSVFIYHPILSLLVLVIGGISTILVTYIWCFVFDKAESGSGFLNMLQQFPIYVSFLVETVRKSKDSTFVSWIYSAYPLSNMYALFNKLVDSKQSFNEMIHNQFVFPLLLMSILNPFIYIIILLLIEKSIKNRKRKESQSIFMKYEEEMKQIRSKKSLSEEIIDEESLLKGSNNNEYEILIKNVSRVFFNNMNKLIPAVNSVSLGVKRGELFGFLGANGAGKSTIMKIITKCMSLSSGEVLINGQTIDNDEPSKLSYCPQFNDHLTPELSIIEHIELFGRLIKLSDSEIEDTKSRLIPFLELEEHKDKLVRELSGGNARKLAILLAFMTPNHVIVLDEPTSSLDPMARHKVHELIREYKGKKTFMICTHLLDEAEHLCDRISMMISGCVYTIGSPQYLSDKFGKEFRIEISCSTDSHHKIQEYISQNIPQCTLSKIRDTSLTYTIPSQSLTLKDLFCILQNGSDTIDGFHKFTCSSSSLEKVFLELVFQTSQEENFSVL